ncbi:MAG: site-specific DNA-methyltransferase [Actinomycetota bacterium]
MATKKTTAKSATKVEATTHAKDTRTNIPTAELEKFAEEDEKKPAKLLYPRDPSLDPQLVWKGKDEQDAADLEVPAVPIYIQETIEPQSIIEDLRRRSKEQSPDDQMALFGDSFAGLEFEDRVDFYQHSGKWTNRMILGDSLLVMASLAEKEGLKGQVQMIYMDPPYGIRFGSNWQVSTRKRDVVDGRAADATRQPEQIRAFRDTWELGIHSYLSYLRDRLVIARDLLSDSGAVFVQIGEGNVHLVRALLDEVFGAANSVATIAFVKTSSSTRDYLSNTYDYLLFYAKEKAQLKFRQLYLDKEPGGRGGSGYTRVELADGTRRSLFIEERNGAASIPVGARLYFLDNLTSQSVGRDKGEGAASWFPVVIDGIEYRPSMKVRWKTNEEGMHRLQLARRVEASGSRAGYVRYWNDFPLFPVSDLWDDTMASFMPDKVYVVQTTRKVIERCILMTTDSGDLVLDPTCGGGTTASVAEEWGRRWITIDTSRVALSLTRGRLMTARFPYYLLADSKEGADKESALTGQPPALTTYTGDVRKGFVSQRAPHIMLSTIAKNLDIKERMTREEIDTAITRHAETEILYDRPYEDKKIVRVTGPFTVESLSPHRVNVDGPEDEPATSLALGVDSARFVERIIEELRAAGVQNTYKGEKLVFDTLEPFAGVCVQATGTYREDGKSMTAAVALGPEYGTVGKELVREAAKEAVEFADILIVCGFAFEALVEDESKVGKLRILKAKMNPDLQMPDLLKKTGAGNLFMVFGEPDIEVVHGEDETVTVAIHGLDVYDPTTGEVRSGGTDDIACWFIDTDYNGEAFFVRHAYFLGADEPYGKLKRALKADIDEEAWASLYSTTSRPRAHHRQDRRQSHQPLRRRDPEGLRGAVTR